MVFITTVLRCLYAQCAADTLLLRCHTDLPQTDADQRPRLLRLYYAAAATFKIILRRHADLEDCTTITIRRSRPYHAFNTLFVRFLRWCIYVLGFKHYLSFTVKRQTWMHIIMLIWFIWVNFSKTKCCLKSKLHRLLTGAGVGGQEDIGYSHGYLLIGGSNFDIVTHCWENSE